MQVNAQIFIDLSMYGHQIWTSPIKTILGSVLLWFYIGPAVFSGLTAMLVLVPLNSLFMGKFGKAEDLKLRYNDSKIKLLNEIFTGIKGIKLYGWEIYFENLIKKIRNLELNIVKKATVLFCCFNFNFGFISFTVILYKLKRKKNHSETIQSKITRNFSI